MSELNAFDTKTVKTGLTPKQNENGQCFSLKFSAKKRHFSSILFRAKVK